MMPSLHEIAKVESAFKLCYFLSQLGIKSAERPGMLASLRYIEIQENIKNQPTAVS